MHDVDTMASHCPSHGSIALGLGCRMMGSMPLGVALRRHDGPCGGARSSRARSFRSINFGWRERTAVKPMPNCTASSNARRGDRASPPRLHGSIVLGLCYRMVCSTRLATASKVMGRVPSRPMKRRGSSRERSSSFKAEGLKKPNADVHSSRRGQH